MPFRCSRRAHCNSAVLLNLKVGAKRQGTSKGKASSLLVVRVSAGADVDEAVGGAGMVAVARAQAFDSYRPVHKHFFRTCYRLISQEDKPLWVAHLGRFVKQSGRSVKLVEAGQDLRRSCVTYEL